MTEVEEFEARIKGIDGVKILDMDHEQLKTFVLTLNTKIIIIEKNIGNLKQILDEISDNYKGFRSGVAERYVSVESYNINTQELLSRIIKIEKNMLTKADMGLTDNRNKASSMDVDEQPK